MYVDVFGVGGGIDVLLVFDYEVLLIGLLLMFGMEVLMFVVLVFYLWVELCVCDVWCVWFVGDGWLKVGFVWMGSVGY